MELIKPGPVIQICNRCTPQEDDGAKVKHCRVLTPQYRVGRHFCTQEEGFNSILYAAHLRIIDEIEKTLLVDSLVGLSLPKSISEYEDPGLILHIQALNRKQDGLEYLYNQAAEEEERFFAFFAAVPARLKHLA